MGRKLQKLKTQIIEARIFYKKSTEKIKNNKKNINYNNTIKCWWSGYIFLMHYGFNIILQIVSPFNKNVFFIFVVQNNWHFVPSIELLRGRKNRFVKNILSIYTNYCTRTYLLVDAFLILREYMWCNILFH